MSINYCLKKMQSSFFSFPREKNRINEDSIMPPLFCGDDLYFAIADGVGGNSYGEIASVKVIDICKGILENNKFISINALIENIWSLYIDFINNNIKYRNAATTFTVCKVDCKKITIGHIGDCRVYSINKNIMKQLTEDHTIANKLQGKVYKNIHALENILTSSFSYESKYTANVYTYNTNKGDIFFACTDGVYKTITSHDILSCLYSYSDITIGLDKIKSILINSHPKDDYSAICIKI